MNIPDSIKSIDVSNLFISRVPQFLNEIENNPTVVLVVVKNKENAYFMEKINATDTIFFFFMKKYMSLPYDLSVIDPMELNQKVDDFFSITL